MTTKHRLSVADSDSIVMSNGWGGEGGGCFASGFGVLVGGVKMLDTQNSFGPSGLIFFAG